MENGTPALSGRLSASPPAWRASPLLLGTIALAWALAITAELTGRVQWVHHHDLMVEQFTLLASVGLFLVAWQVHVAAMMLPSALPMYALFRRASDGQPRPQATRVAFVAGYAAVWTAFGIAALAGDALLQLARMQWHGLMHHPELIAGAVFIVAGAFQFSALKERCMDKCRHPAMFLMQHYRRGVDHAFRLGAHHGLYCLGCCWALMLVMFVVGIANLAWMAPLALLMLYEKVGRYGPQIVRPVGVGLILLGAVVMADPAWLPAIVPSGIGPHTH